MLQLILFVNNNWVDTRWQ